MVGSDQGIKWYLCLITHQSHGKIKTENRTIVLATWLPISVLNFMNLCEENNIVIAATKALKSIQVLSTQKGVGLSLIDNENIILQPKFNIACMIGPLTDVILVKQILRFWEQHSRGQPSRTILAGEIVKKFRLDFSINFHSLFGINPCKFDIDVHEDVRKKESKVLITHKFEKK